MTVDRDVLILGHMELADKIANREWRTAVHALSRDVMVSVAYLGLVEAAQRWEPYCKERGFDPEAIQYFKVFASLRIRGAIRDHIRKEDWATRTLRTKSKRLKDAGQDNGLSVTELSERTGMTVPEINKVIAKLASRPLSLTLLSNRVGNDGDSTPEFELREVGDTEGISFASAMNREFIKQFNALPHQSRVVLVLKYYAGMDLREISTELGIPNAKVSQIHSQAVLSIQSSLAESAREEDFVDV